MEKLNLKSIESAQLKQWKEIVGNLSYYEKVANDEELQVLKQVDDSTSEVVNFYGVDTSPAVLDVHLVDRAKWPEGHAFFSREHGMFVCENNDLEVLRFRLTHEMFHYKGVNFLPEPLTEAIVERLTNQALNSGNLELKGSAMFSGMYTYRTFGVALDSLIQKIISKAPAGITDDYRTFSSFCESTLIWSRKPS